MDGNRRWAKERGLPTLEGHRKGGDVLLDSIRFGTDKNIPHAVYYAFSTENWKRSKQEVEYLMRLFGKWLDRIETELLAEAEGKVRVRIVGRREDFREELQARMNHLEEISTTSDNTTTVWVALSYGGRAEIVEAVNRAIEKGEEVHEQSFKELLWTAELPDPDIIVRTSGEQRLSNFLTWSSVYSELYFIEKHWPALTNEDFEDILNEYGKRERRRGA